MREAPFGGQPIRVPEGRSLTEAFRLTVLVFSLALPFLIYVTLSVRQVSLEYVLSELVARRQELSRERERLALQRAALLSPAQVDRVATEVLGMVPEDTGEPVLAEAPP